jgi:hypothetical protein
MDGKKHYRSLWNEEQQTRNNDSKQENDNFCISENSEEMT